MNILRFGRQQTAPTMAQELPAGNMVLVQMPLMQQRRLVVSVVDPVHSRTVADQSYPVYRMRSAYLPLPGNL